MLTALIIEDEKNSREFLEKLIVRNFSDKLVVLDAVNSVAKGVEAIKKYKSALNIVFLDIHMPQENGFELFKHIRDITPDVIFTTAYKDYAINAIKFSAFDYLLKPINFIDLNSTLKRLENRTETNNNKLKINTLMNNIGTDSLAYNKIAFPTLDGFVLEKIGDIVYCKAQNNYALIKTNDNREILLSKTLKHIEEILPKQIFCRTHKSFLVNLNYIASYSRADHVLMLNTNEQLPVSVRKNEQFINAILQKE
ncbi:LytR/AlgR family response regulator transcription factor [Winogradskyella helgolandensis]|uniref:LytR/AlgR family response regulator transcription factor n=1 Tax=Winogradskyella helgolandensis TaxID=2697010 RepID=UPI0015CB0145|nr:LytTR family DNA-binding domain-containing protein [Winogradskyella helgolandensis]